MGRSSLLLGFSDKQWLPEDETSATIGVDFRVRIMFSFSSFSFSFGNSSYQCVGLLIYSVGAQDGDQRKEG